MNKLYKSWIAILLVAVLLVPMIPAVGAAPAAQDIVTTPTGYKTAQDVVYKSVGGYTVNWGARGEDCGFLSSRGQLYYGGDHDYEVISVLDGGTAAADASDSALYEALQTMMVSHHTTFTSYGGSSSVDCKNFYKYTDCFSGDDTYVSTLYQGLTVNGTWDSGKTYNQEHMWPKSKCLTTDEIGDIMHLRPANPTENSSRGNTAYGLSSGYYDPGAL